MIEFKIWYYQRGCQNGDEQSVKNMIPDSLPEEIKERWKLSHPPASNWKEKQQDRFELSDRS